MVSTERYLDVLKEGTIMWKLESVVEINLENVWIVLPQRNKEM